MAKFESIRYIVTQMAFKVCVESNHYNFVENTEQLYAALEDYLGIQRGRLAQVEDLKPLIRFELEWLKDICRKHSQEFIYGLVQSRIQSCRTTRMRKCKTPGCNYPKANFRAEYCPRCQPRIVQQSRAGRAGLRDADTHTGCLVCGGAMLPGESYCLACLGD